MMKILFSCLAVCAVMVAASPAAAVTIRQGAGDNYIAFEAEIGDLTTFDVDIFDDRDPTIFIETRTHGWEVQDEPTASGGKQIQATNPGGSLNSFPENTAAASYGLTFNTAGVYNLYVRHAPRNNGRNSAYISNVLGNTVEGADNVFDNRDSHADFAWNLRTHFRASDQDVVDGLAVDGDPMPPDHPAAAPYTFEVFPAQLGTPLMFSLKKRENLYEADRFVFTLDAPANNTETALDGLVNSANNFVAVIPEPSTAILAAMSLLALATGRKRSRS